MQKLSFSEQISIGAGLAFATRMTRRRESLFPNLLYLYSVHLLTVIKVMHRVARRISLPTMHHSECHLV